MKTMKETYEKEKYYANLFRELYKPEERLERLERVEMVLRMWADNANEPTEMETLTDGYGRECMEIGYRYAMTDVLCILGESSNRIYPKYKKLMEKFEAEAEAEKEQATTNNGKEN